MQKLSMAEIAKKTGKSEKMVSFTITTARQRGIKIPYKTRQKRKINEAREKLKERLIDLLGEHKKQFDYRKFSRMFEKGLSISAVANEIDKELNISNQKANTIAQTIYYLRKMK